MSQSHIAESDLLTLVISEMSCTFKGITNILAVSHRDYLNMFLPILCMVYSFLGKSNWYPEQFPK